MHRLRFLTREADQVICAMGPHRLGENFPFDDYWQYCCECQTYYPSNMAKTGKVAAECLVCERAIAKRYLCDQCKVMSVESNAASRRKSFGILEQGTIDPICPGCLGQTIAPVTNHKCVDLVAERLHVTYSTALTRCPFCEEQLVNPNEHEYLAFAHIGGKIKIVSLTPDGKYRFLDERKSVHNILYVASPEVLVLQEAVEELERLVNNSKSKEADFQEFFTRHKDLILNDEYRNAHSHIVLADSTGESLIPDFVLEPINQGSLCDLLELKLPSVQLFNLKKSRMRYSAAVAEACAQLRQYNRFFEEERNRKYLFERYRLLAYKPKMFVVIGRRGSIDPIDVRGMQTDYPNLNLLTYDDIIDRAKWKVERRRSMGIWPRA